MKTIGDRITKALHAATLLRTGLYASAMADCPVDEHFIRESLGPQAEIVGIQLLWLSNLPKSVLEAPSPDWDEQVRLDVKRPDEGMRRLVEGALAVRIKPAPKERRKRVGAK